MHILITGAGGMLGQKLAQELARQGLLDGSPITHITLHDLRPISLHLAEPARITKVAGDIAAVEHVRRLLMGRPDVIYHLAAIVSGEAEADFELGYRVNLHATRNILETIRQLGTDYCPRLIFSSSIAVYGAPLPSTIPDDHILAPLTSYGTEKAMCELLLSDYSRRGYVDAVGLRFPTICVRPGQPNRAVSGFFSSIIREPLAGQEAVLPVPEETRHWIMSPRAAITALLHAATLSPGDIGSRRTLTLPGLSVTVRELIETLERLAGRQIIHRIRREPDDEVMRIVSGWPTNFDTVRARRLGFRSDRSVEDVIRSYIEDELEGSIP